MTDARREQLTDEQLIGRLRSGDPHAFELFVDRYFGMVFAVARARLGTREEAEDLAQEVFLRAFLHLDRLKQPRYLSAWLTRIARNLAADWQKRGQRRDRLVEKLPLGEAARKAAHEGSPIVSIQNEERRKLVDDALQNLPPENREVLLLHFTERMSKKDIADTLGVHPSTVGRQIEKALDAIRDRVLEGMGELRPSREMRGRTAVALSVLAALPAGQRAALAAGAPVAAVPAMPGAGAWLIGLPGATGLIIVVLLLATVGMVWMRTPSRGNAAIDSIVEMASRIDSYRYWMEAVTVVDGETFTVEERGVFVKPHYYAMDRLHSRSSAGPGSEWTCRIVRTGDGLHEFIRPHDNLAGAVYTHLTNNDIMAGIPAALEQRPRLNEPFLDMEPRSLRLERETATQYIISGRTRPVEGHIHSVHMTFDKDTGLLRRAESRSTSGPAMHGVAVISRVEINPVIDPHELKP